MKLSFGKKIYFPEGVGWSTKIRRRTDWSTELLVDKYIRREVDLSIANWSTLEIGRESDLSRG